MMRASRPASRAAPNTIFWNRSRLMAPEQEKVANKPPGRSRAHSQPVDVFVAAGGAIDLIAGGGEFGRIQDDHVEPSTLVSPAAQLLKYVGVSVRPTVGCESVQVEGAGGQVEGFGAGVEVDDVGGVSSEGVDGEGAGVAEGVQHFSPGAVRRCLRRDSEPGRDRSRSCVPPAGRRRSAGHVR